MFELVELWVPLINYWSYAQIILPARGSPNKDPYTLWLDGRPTPICLMMSSTILQFDELGPYGKMNETKQASVTSGL